MRISWATACRQLEILEGGVANIVEAGLNTFEVDDLPYGVSFTVAMMITAAAEEVGQTFTIPVELCGPGNPILIATLDDEVEIEPPPPGHPLGYLVTDFHSIDVSFDADAPGMYSVELRQPEGDPNAPADDVRGCPVFFFVTVSVEGQARIDADQDES